MSKPRWIDGGVFRTLRTATRKRSLAVIVGPGHGTAPLSTRTALREALGDGDRASLAEDARCRSEVDEGLAALWTLKQPGLVTTSVSDALMAARPADLEETPRLYGPDGKGLKGAWDKKGCFVAHLWGVAAEPSTLVLSDKGRKPLIKPDSRYQAFLRATFARTVLFTGFDLSDPDLNTLLEDVARGFNGHVPQNIVLVPEGSTDPAAALKASMHYGMNIVEFPAERGTAGALAEVANLLEELEVPKPATGNPPRGYTELDEAFRSAVGAGDLETFLAGDSSSWTFIKAEADVPRTAAASLREALLAEAPEGKVPVGLVRGRAGDGKTSLARRLAWSLASEGVRVFWREPGVGLPDRYVPAEADDARAVFVADDAEELTNLPVLLRQLAAQGEGKARLLLVADEHEWERSGLDHRIRPHAEVHDVSLTGLDDEEAAALVERLSSAGRLEGSTDDAKGALAKGDGVLLERVFAATGRGGIGGVAEGYIKALQGKPDEELMRRALLATSMVHRWGMAIQRGHLAAFLDVPAAELQAKVLEPLKDCLVLDGEEAVRLAHPVLAAALVPALAPDDNERDEVLAALLKALPTEQVSDHTVLARPSELIRARRTEPMPPLTLGRLFEAGEHAARNDLAFWFDRGRYEADFSRWDQALAAFDQALWRSPGEPSEKEHNALVHANRARCFQSLGKKKQALDAVDEGLRHSSSDGSLLRLREKLGGRRPPRGGTRGGGGRRGGPGGGGQGRGGPGGGRGGPGGGRGGPGGGRGGPGQRGGPGGGQGQQGRPRQGPPAPRA